MGKVLDAYEKYQDVKKPFQIFIYIFIAVAVVSTIIGAIYGMFFNETKIYITNFMQENVSFHDNNYIINISEARTVDSIEYKDKKGNNIVANGNFIKVSFKINQLSSSTISSHKLDFDDFKLKDHSGVYIPMNDIMTFFDIDALDMHLSFDNNELLMSNADFSTKKAINDYSWYGEKISCGTEINLVIYFKMDEGFKVEQEAMIFEVDFFSNLFPSKLKNGTDILLCLCNKNNE